MQASVLAWIVLIPVTVAVSSLAVWASIFYAHSRNLIDHPGRRRSHDLPTPRGGGIGIVVGVLVGMCVFLFGPFGDQSRGQISWGSSALLVFFAAIALVAIVGWIDDHRGLSAKWRMCAHVIATFLLGVPSLALLWPEFATNPAASWIAAALLICALAIVWSINLHNFMDGTNGLLALQAIFVFVVLAWICAQAGRGNEALVIALFAAATLGFLPFNFPRAHIFMGDVGSGVLGLLVAVAVGWQMAAAPAVWMAGLIAASAFVVDSTCTLLSRLLSGRRWYSAHREHLYQWLARSGFSHAGVAGLYLGWNLLIVLPALIWSGAMTSPPGTSAQPGSGGKALLAVYVLAVLVWVFGKRYCLTKPRVQGS